MDFLEDDEFLILEDDMTHMVDPSDIQVKFSPSILRLTNTRVTLESCYEINRKVSAPLSKIATFAQNVYNECAVLDILCDNRLNNIHVFIPEAKRRFGFAQVLSGLCSASERGQKISNELALRLRRKRLSCQSLDEFYEIVTTPTRENSMSELSEESRELQHKEITESVLETLNPFNVFADFVETAPSLFFTVMAVMAALLTLIFRYISFGVVVCNLFMAIMIESAIRVAGTKRKELEKLEVDKDDTRKSVKLFVAACNQFRELIGNRFFWYNRIDSLEVLGFITLVFMLFMIFDPFVLLVVSLIGLAFFERWDPFHIGSLPAILSNLFLW